MMKILNRESISLLSIMCVLISCNARSIHNKEMPSNGKTLTLIICASGETRAHIISIDSTNTLSYLVGNFLNKEGSYSITYNADYKEIKRDITSKDAKELMELSIDEEALAYEDSLIVKDGWDYYLFINGRRKAFGSSNHIELYPDKLKRIISLILDIAGELYDLPGFS